MSIDPGFSHHAFLLESQLKSMQPDENFSIKNKIFMYLAIAPKVLADITAYKMNGIKFERLDIDIPFASLQSIFNDRESALNNNLVNQNPTKVKAKLRFKGRTFKSSIRLKGDLKDHWFSKYRMSLRVELTGNKTLLGFKEFSIQKPHSRQFPYDLAYASALRSLGNISSLQKFAHVFVNGKSWGIMNIEEHMTKEFLEKQKRKESIIVKFGGEGRFDYIYNATDSYEYYRLNSGEFTLDSFKSKRYMKDIKYREFLTYISNNQLGFKSHLYDETSFLNSYIASTLWANWHTLLDANHRYYFNPYTLKLESISTDQGPFERLNYHDGISSPRLEGSPILAGQFSSVLKKIKQNNELLSAAKLNINKISDDKHFKNYSKYFPLNKQINTEVLNENIKEFLLNTGLYLDPNFSGQKDISSENFFSQIALPTKKQASQFPHHLYFKHFDDGRLEVFNLLPDTVIVNEIGAEGIATDETNYSIPGYIESPKPVILQTRFRGIHDNKINIVSTYQGFKKKSKNQYTLLSNLKKNPLLDDAFECSRLCKFDGKNYIFNKAHIEIMDPLIIHGDVVLQEGTHLSFGPNAYMIIKGSLKSLGSRNLPVTLDAVSKYWKGIYVLNASKRSTLQFTNIKNLTALEDGLLQLTGAITFYKSDVDFKNVTLEDIVSEDALNIVNSNYLIRNTSINNAASDAFDSDFSDGLIENSFFYDINGDALDFSGSKATIKNVQIKNIGDKGISAGEQSSINIFNSVILNTMYGLVSKDNSIVLLESSEIDDFEMYGAMTFIKKDFYSNSSYLNIKNSKIEAPYSYMRQEGTILEVDSIEVPEQKFDVDEIYLPSSEIL